jgi:hypothetical protein
LAISTLFGEKMAISIVVCAKMTADRHKIAKSLSKKYLQNHNICVAGNVQLLLMLRM